MAEKSKQKISSILIVGIMSFIIGGAVCFIIFTLTSDKTVAMVNGTPIKRSEIYQVMKDQIGGKTIHRQIDNLIVEQTAGKYGINISDQELETELNKKIDLEYHSREAFLKSLADLNLTLAEAKKELRLGMLFDRIATKDIQVNDTEVQQYYQKHQDEFLRPEMRRVREIVVKTRAEAENVRKELLNGADFGQLVQEKSIGLDRDKGGDRGFIVKGLLNPIAPPVEKIVFETGKNQISPAIQCPDGFHLIRVEEIIPQYQSTYGESKPAIELKLKIGKSRPFQEVLNQIRKDSSIQMLENFDRGGK